MYVASSKETNSFKNKPGYDQSKISRSFPVNTWNTRGVLEVAWRWMDGLLLEKPSTKQQQQQKETNKKSTVKPMKKEVYVNIVWNKKCKEISHQCSIKIKVLDWPSHNQISVYWNVWKEVKNNVKAQKPTSQEELKQLAVGEWATLYPDESANLIWSYHQKSQRLCYLLLLFVCEIRFESKSTINTSGYDQFYGKVKGFVQVHQRANNVDRCSVWLCIRKSHSILLN